MNGPTSLSTKRRMGEFALAASIIPISPPMDVPIQSMKGDLLGARRRMISDIRIIRANINLEPLDRIAARHGFEAVRDPIKPSTWERVHQFGENILFFLLVLACNPRGRLKNFSRRRQLLYLSRRVCDSKQLKRSGVWCSASPR